MWLVRSRGAELGAGWAGQDLGFRGFRIVVRISEQRHRLGSPLLSRQLVGQAARHDGLSGPTVEGIGGGGAGLPTLVLRASGTSVMR
jgi:hypothetical protein